MANEEPFRPVDQTLTDPVLVEAHNGMKVFDRNGNEIGKVDGVYLGEVNEKVDERGKGAATAINRTPAQGGFIVPSIQGSQQAYIADVNGFLQQEQLPQPLLARLLREGFIRITGGLFSEPRYALPSQISSVQGDRINLNVTKDELIKR